MKQITVKKKINVMDPNKERCCLCGRKMGPTHPPSVDDTHVCCVCDQQGLKAPVVKKKKAPLKKKVNPLS